MMSAPVIYARTPACDYRYHLTFCPEGAECMFPQVSDSLQDLRDAPRMLCVKRECGTLMGIAGRLDDILAGRESSYIQLDQRRQVCFIGVLVRCDGGETPSFPDTGMLLDSYESLMGGIWGLPADSETLSAPVPTVFSEYPMADSGGKVRRLRRGKVRCKSSGEAKLMRSAIACEEEVAVCANGTGTILKLGSFDTVGMRCGLLGRMP